MTPETFEQLQQAYADGGADRAFELLIETLRAEKDYGALFDALLMKRRYELHIPLLSRQGPADLDKGTRRKYEDAYVVVCREIGELYLADGDILQAWPYFRTIGEPQRVRDVLEQIEDSENMDELINIAYREGAHPRKGFEWILKHYGTCSAITSYEQFPPGVDGKSECGAKLVRQLHEELATTLKNQIEQKEGAAPAANSIPQLLQGRDWLMDPNNYTIDLSHLAAVTRFSVELEDPEALRLGLELADYGSRLPETGHYGMDLSVQDHLRDCAIYLRALLGEEVETGIAHFKKKVIESGPDQGRSGPAQLLVYLFVRLGRFEEAIEASLEYLADVPAEMPLLCPSIMQLCQMSNNHQRLMELARERGDLLTFAAGLLEGEKES
jgi:hypothetical protein